MESVLEMHDQVLYRRNAEETSQRTSKKRGNSKKNSLTEKQNDKWSSPSKKEHRKAFTEDSKIQATIRQKNHFHR